MNKIFVVGLRHYAFWINDSILVNDIKEADIVLFTGGEDVCPYFYGDKIHPTTHFNVSRDIKELDIFHSLPQHVLKLGVCRGAQFLCVASGGKLIQDVPNHTKTHDLILYDDTIVKITSTHHQMIDFKRSRHLDMIVIGTSTEIPNISNEVEIAYIENTNSLCIQGHPEMMEESEIHYYLNNIIKNRDKMHLFKPVKNSKVFEKAFNKLKEGSRRMLEPIAIEEPRDIVITLGEVEFGNIIENFEDNDEYVDEMFEQGFDVMLNGETSEDVVDMLQPVLQNIVTMLFDEDAISDEFFINESSIRISKNFNNGITNILVRNAEIVIPYNNFNISLENLNSFMEVVISLI